MKHAFIIFAGAFLAPTALAQTPVQTCNLYNQQFTIYFEHESIEITKFARAVLDQALDNIADAPDTCKVKTITIDSHTDTSGSDKRNMLLSQAIAQNFVDVFTSLEFSPADMKVSAHGESWPAKPTRNDVRSPLNRRTEIQITLTPK